MCQVSSVHGNSKDGFGGLKMMFGGAVVHAETNCIVNLTQCYPGLCYSFLDVTNNLPSDADYIQQAGSLFSDVKVVSGAASVKLTQNGVAFEANASAVVLQYSTYNCQSFYRYRGGIAVQQCSTPIEAITVRIPANQGSVHLKLSCVLEATKGYQKALCMYLCALCHAVMSTPR
eukprot:jgi/Chrzof1/13878/Cz08g15280.t1